MGEEMANIFENIQNENVIFKDKKPLDHRFLPERLLHREDQVTQIARYWVDALNDVTPSNITIYGKTGTGKTAAAKFARSQLLEFSADQDVFIKIEYIRCTDYTTEYQVLAQLCQKLGRDVPHRGWTKAEVVNTFRDIFKTNLTRTDNVSILSISNFLDFKGLIKSRVTSSLNDKEIVFPPYGASQLTDILTERANLAFNEGVVESDVIPLCSAMAAKEEGDARFALDLLKTSGFIAEEEGSSTIKSSHVRMAKDRIEHDKFVDVVKTLPTQQQRVLEAILNLTNEKEEITSGKLYEAYSEVSKKDAVTYRRIFDFINELEMLGIISTNTISRGRGKGRTNIIKLQCDEDLLESSLYSSI